VKTEVAPNVTTSQHGQSEVFLSVIVSKSWRSFGSTARAKIITDN